MRELTAVPTAEFSRCTCSAVANRNLILAASHSRQSALYSAMLSAVIICGNTGAGGNVSGVFIEVTSMLLTATIGHRVAGVNSSSRSEEHTSELQSLRHLVCRLLL